MFRSFFLGGFEGAAGHNIHRQWFDGVSLTHHDRFLREDYALLKSHNIFAVRECVRWPLVDKGTHFDFGSLYALITAGRAAGITTIYDLFHFGYPMTLDPLSEEFLKRFVEYCYQVARCVARQTEDVCYFTPVNEPSYFAWAGGQVGAFAPYLKGAGRDLKVALVRAAILGTEAIWAACPNARIVTVDPFCRAVPASADKDAVQRAEFFNSSVVFEAWDMIAGRVMPELGGSLRHLDIVGINYYWTNQWVLDEPWAALPDEDRRRMPLRHIAKTVWARYRREILISETSHIGDMRPRWMRELITETEAIRSFQIPLLGICWYPVLEMAEWHTPGVWTRLGLWDLVHQDGSMRRAAYKPVLRALREAQERLQGDSAKVRRLFGGSPGESRIKAILGFP